MPVTCGFTSDHYLLNGISAGHHDHFVSEGGLEPFAYVLGGSADAWLGV